MLPVYTKIDEVCSTNTTASILYQFPLLVGNFYSFSFLQMLAAVRDVVGKAALMS